MLFREVPFLERFDRVAQCGMDAVEFWWPSEEERRGVEAAVRGAGVEVAVMNLPAGDMARGDRGLLGDRSRFSEFSDQLDVALTLAQRLDCRRLNALVGLRIADDSGPEQLAFARENVAAIADRAAAQGAVVLIEAINTFDNGPYLVSTTDAAVRFVQSIGRPNVLLQYDTYHMQRMEGNLTATLQKYADLLGHIQIADAPGRGEPGTGEINFSYLFGAIDSLGYDGFIGLEYAPSTPSTLASLGWIAEYCGIMRSPSATAEAAPS